MERFETGDGQPVKMTEPYGFYISNFCDEKFAEKWKRKIWRNLSRMYSLKITVTNHIEIKTQTFMKSLFKKRKQLTETDFAKKFVKRLQKKVIGLQLVSINGLEIVTQKGDSKEYCHFLDNSFAEYQNEPDELNEILERYTEASKELFVPKEDVKVERVVPVIKDKRFLTETTKINPLFETDYAFENYNSELLIFYAEDKKNSISYLSKEEIESLNFGSETLRKRAVCNLNSVITEIKKHGENGYYMLTAGGVYEFKFNFIGHLE
jgi:hypothetical protein